MGPVGAARSARVTLGADSAVYMLAPGGWVRYSGPKILGAAAAIRDWDRDRDGMEWSAVDALVAAVERTEWDGMGRVEGSWAVARVLDAYRDAMYGDVPWSDVAILAEEAARKITGPDGDTLTGDIRRILAEIAETAWDVITPEWCPECNVETDVCTCGMD